MTTMKGRVEGGFGEGCKEVVCCDPNGGGGRLVHLLKLDLSAMVCICVNKEEGRG